MSSRRRKKAVNPCIPSELKVNLSHSMRKDLRPEQFERTSSSGSKSNEKSERSVRVPKMHNRVVKMRKDMERIREYNAVVETCYSHSSGTQSYESLLSDVNLPQVKDAAIIEPYPDVYALKEKNLMEGLDMQVIPFQDMDLQQMFMGEDIDMTDAKKYYTVPDGELEREMVNSILLETLSKFHRLPRDDLHFRVSFSKVGNIPSMEMEFVRQIPPEEKPISYQEYVRNRKTRPTAMEPERPTTSKASSVATTTARSDSSSATDSSAVSHLSTLSRTSSSTNISALSQSSTLSRLTTSTSRTFRGTINSVISFLRGNNKR